MKIIINDFGSKLSLKQDMIIISSKDKKQTIPIDCISEIIISNSCLLTSDIIHKCIKNNILFSFIDDCGSPYLYMEDLNNACSPIIKRKQLLLCESNLGVKIIKSTITQKIKNRQEHLCKLAKNRDKDIRDYIKENVDNIKQYINTIQQIDNNNLDKIRQTIQAYEGNAGRIYFSVISNLLKSKYKFKGRSFNPAKDYYNCMLNYSYGVMYGKIYQSCIKARLDPYIGIMHKDIYNKPTLTYDLIEPYRIYCEETVFKLFSKSMVKEDMFYAIDGGYFLNEKGKKLLLTEYYKTLNKKEKLNNKSINISKKIDNDIILLSKTIGESNIC